MDLKVSNKYKHLFDRPESVDTYVITGGRFSQKSFAVGTASVYLSIHKEHRILYGRYTSVSTKDSTFPEVEEKINLLEYENYFNISQNRIDCNLNESKIIFKGFKTGSKVQSASLKSLKDFSCLIIEEAEEIPDFDTYEKVSLSIRGNINTDEPNIKILILNPTTKEHWIYKNFFEEKGIKGGYNGIKDNVCYIHTSYLDCLEFVPPDILRSFNNMKLKSPNRYRHIVEGGWLEKAEGVVFENWSIGKFDDSLPSIYGMDFGYVNDATTLVKVSQTKEKIYTKLKLYKKGMSTSDIINFLDGNVTKNDLIVADSAEPRLIDEIRVKGFNIVKCRKGPDSIKNGLAKMYVKEIISEEQDIETHRELNNYCFHDKKSNTPIDNWNHIIDAIRYAHQELNEDNNFWVT